MPKKAVCVCVGFYDTYMYTSLSFLFSIWGIEMC